MLDFGNDQMLSFALQGAADPAKHPVISFRSAGSKIYFVRFRSDQPGDRIAGFVHSLLRRSPVGVLAVRISVNLPEIRKHFLQNFFVRPRGRGMIEVNFFHGLSPYLSLSAGLPARRFLFDPVYMV